MIKTFRNSILFLTLLILVSCAHIVPPGGGLKDTTPPKMVKAKPDTFSTHFNAAEIRIDFDEFVQLKDEMNQIIISPPMEKAPIIKAQKKSVVVKFKEKLKDSTTYNINFGNSISDTHEGNVKEGFQYVFSTGDYVDSLSLSGRCKFAKDLKSEKGVLVMLYKNLDDSIPALKKPDYFAKTDSAGRFRISNVKEGTYKVFALKDLNNNYLYDQPTEVIGYQEEPVNITTKDTVNIFLFEALKTKQYIVKSSCEEFGKMVFIFNKPPILLDFNFLNNDPKDTALSFFEYSKAKDTVIYWFTHFAEDSMKMIVSDDGKVLDTLSILIKPKEPKKKNDKSPKFLLNISTLPVPGAMLSPQSEWMLLCSHPIDSFDSTQFILKEDTIPIKGFKVSGLDSTKRKIKINYDWKEGSTYALSFPKGTFKDIFGLVNDTVLNFMTKIKSATDYGTLRLKFKVPANGSNYILQLMNEREDVIQQDIVAGDTLINYTFLSPAKYKVKLIFDTNNNGKWDTGNYFKHLQPEKVTYCKEIFTVRANWDVDATWTIKSEE